MSTSTNNSFTFNVKPMVAKVENPQRKMNAMKGAQVTNRKRRESKLAIELEQMNANNFIEKTKQIRYSARQESAKRIVSELQDSFNQRRIK